jgi:hypothetical protein
MTDSKGNIALLTLNLQTDTFLTLPQHKHLHTTHNMSEENTSDCPRDFQMENHLHENSNNVALYSPSEATPSPELTAPTPSTDDLAADPERLVSPEEMDGANEREESPTPSAKALGKQKVVHFEEVRYVLGSPYTA